MIPLLCHLLGDYFIQSDWMAIRKTKRSWICAVHVLLYTSVFAGAMALGLLRWSVPALMVVYATHFLIDRFYLSRYICYAKNFMAPKSWWYSWEDGKMTGYLIGDHAKDPRCKPAFIAVWLMIITDNSMHIAFNYFALRHL